MSEMRLRMVRAQPKRTARLTAPKDNSWPAAKLQMRRWLSTQVQIARAYEVFGFGGMGSDTWRSLGAHAEGVEPGLDGVASLDELADWAYDAWDVDSWGSPFAALKSIAARATRQRVAIFLTDGHLRKSSGFRGPLVHEVVDAMGWEEGALRPGGAKHLKAWIYHHYPQVVRMVAGQLLGPRYKIEQMKLILARGTGAANYIGIVATRTDVK